MADMFQRRPDWKVELARDIDERRVMGGTLYFVPQSRLTFGQSAKPKRVSRPAVLASFDQTRAYVLPCTKIRNYYRSDHKYCIPREDCPGLRIDSYVYHDAELVPRSSLRESLCTISPERKKRLMAWYLKQNRDLLP